MQEFSIPGYAVGDGNKTTYGSIMHVKQRLARFVRDVIDSRMQNYPHTPYFTVYKRDGEKYVPVFSGEMLKQLPGDYDQVRKEAYHIIESS